MENPEIIQQVDGETPIMYLGPTRIGNFKPKLEKKKRRRTPVEKRDGKDPDYLAKLRQMPCVVCKAPAPSEIHHLKATGERGGALRSGDKWGLPMCHDCHINGVERHGSRREVSWFQHNGIDPLTLANSLWNSRHDLEAMMNILATHRGKR